jgi:amino acid adenylation domain-containing protein
MLFADLFAAQVAAAPDAIAVEDGARRVTYAELDAHAARLAGRLRAAGVGPEVVVGLAVGRCADLIAAILGIVRSGGAWLPLDPAYPMARLRYMLADAGVRIVVSDGQIDLGDPDLTVIPPDATQAPGPARAERAPESTAYVLYTSGSTGRPKGVVVSQAALANFIRAVAGPLEIGPGTRMLQFATVNFDVSIYEFAVPLATGGTVVMVPADVRLDGARLVDLAAAHRVTHALLPPSVLAALPDAPLPDLRVLVAAGEALTAPVAARWAPGRRLVNGYGPTEATILATFGDVGATGRPSIGRPVDGLHIVLLRPDLRPVAAGETGEIAIGGAGVARGYLGRPGLTAQRYVPDPTVPGGRLYRTGDLGRWRPDGELDFLGRLDHQVKIRGYRIELDEVAAVLREHPAVRDAVAVVAPGGDALVGYVSPAEAAPAELRAFLTERLPAYMVPGAIVALPALPLTPSGKVDRAALPAPDRVASGLADAATAPRTATERAIAAIVAGLLGRPEVGVTDNFFALGGHSLLVGMLAARIRTGLGVEIPLPELFAGPTVAAMARLVDAGTGAAVLPPIEPTDRGGALPLSFPQERVWYLEQLVPGNIAYNAQMAIRLRGPLDVAALRATLTEIVRRHEILRTSFESVDGVPVQRVRPPVAVALPVLDAPAGPDGVDDALFRRLVARPFDLADPPLARWTLVRHDRDDHTLVQAEHHFVHDGWSLAVLLQEIGLIYPELAAGRSVTVPAPAIQYGDFAVWQRRWMRGAVLDAHLRYWTDVLAGAPPVLDLPTDRPRPARPTLRGDAVRCSLPPELSRRLRRFAAAHGITLYGAMLAGFAALLHRHTGAGDLVVGAGMANRRAAETERLIGMVVNTLPLRLRVDSTMEFAELARRTHAVAVDAAGWQDVPLDRLVEAIGVPRDPSRNPLFQVMFSFHDSAVPDLEFAGLRGDVDVRNNGSAKTDLNVIVIPRAEQRAGRAPRDAGDEEIALLWEYATDLFDPATAQRLVAQYLRLLDAAVTDPSRTVADLPLLDPADVRTLSRDWARADAPYPGGRDIVTLFEEQVRLRPEAVAVRAGGRDVTYAELNARANRLAHLLRERGVRAEDSVAVLLPRGADLIAALVGVLKAGAAYLPLDPTYPVERLAAMAADVGARFAVADDRTAPAGLDVEAVIGPADAAGFPAANPGVAVHPRQLACVFFTSGSTGRPKGVMVEHRGVVRLVRGTNYQHLGPDERIAQAADVSFDAATYEIWGALLNGGTLCVLPTETVLTPAALGAALRRDAVTSLFLTTALFHEVAAAAPETFDGLTNLLFGGEACAVRRVRAALGHPRRLVHMYGPTEVTTYATYYPVRHVPDAATSVPIGRPVANTAVYVLDERLAPVPVGVPGELYLGGPGVTRGYAGQPGATASRFLPDPFAADGSRMYRTGDRARWRSDGTVEFLGRLDDQVKIRGFRIEPGEIATRLAEHPAVSEAYVVVRDAPAGDRHLVAYVVAAGALTPADLGSWLADRLPPYLRPAAYVLLDALPIGPHGKVDRDALPAPAPTAAGDVEAPATATERRLASVWARLLDVPSVGRTQDFFALGGHSLLATRLLAQVHQAFGVAVGLGDFLARPDVAGLAAAIERGAIDAGTGAARPGRRGLGRAEAAALLERVDRLTDDEVESLLRELDEESEVGS